MAASPNRAITTQLPITLLLRPVPIYTRATFRELHDVKSKWRGWAVVHPDVYWCERAFDKGAKGGQAWRVDVEEWREGGKRGEGWTVSTIPLPEVVVEKDDSDSGSDSGSDAEVGHESDEEDVEEGESTPKKRKRAAITPKKVKAKPPARPAKKRKTTTVAPGRSAKKGKKLPHPQASSSHIPASIPNLDDLPVDPYRRALRLLHVGATPESLPCREEEFVEVLSKVEEGVEGGGGGCLCELMSPSYSDPSADQSDIAGVPGTGKTATVHAVVKELKRKAEDGVSSIVPEGGIAADSCIRNCRPSPMSRSTVSKSHHLNMHIRSSGKRFQAHRAHPPRLP